MAEPIPMPDDPGVPDEVLRHDAQWASRFSPSNTSLAQRGRARRSVNQYAVRLQDRQAQERERQIATNKEAQTLWYRGQQLQRQTERDAAQLAANHEKAQAAAELQPLKIERLKTQAQADIARARAAETTELLKVRSEAMTARDTAGFAERITGALNDGHTPGTKEFADTFLRSVAAFPGASKDMVRGFASQAKIETSADDLVAELQKLPPEMRGKIRATSGPGGWKATTEAAPAFDPVKRLSHVESLRARATDPDVIKYLDEDISSLRQAVPAGQVPVVPVGAPVAAPVSPSAPQSAPAPQGGVLTKEAYDALPPGAEFTHNGRKGIKPKPTAATP